MGAFPTTMTSTATKERLALDTCDQEPIHIPGRTQPFGVLLAGPVDLNRIDYVSGNTAEFLGSPAEDLLGKPFASLLSSDAIHDARNLMGYSTSRLQRERVCIAEIAGTQFEVFVHVNVDNLAIIELEPFHQQDADAARSVDRMRIYLAKAGEQKNLTNMLKICVLGLKEITGYDRVLAYRYASNGDGEVVAEAREPKAESFLGLRYPAWDVPTQARALQIKNPLRMLSDVTQEPVPLLAADSELPPLDISLAHLRGVSPIHVKYLANMGVAATLTLGIVVDGKLWGMFACHHLSPKVTRTDLRVSGELFSQLISLLIQQQIELEKSRARTQAEEARRRILADTDAATDLLHAFPKFGPIMQDLIQSDGFAVVRDEKVQKLGSTPSSAAILEIAKRNPDDDNLLEHVDNLEAAGWTGGESLAASAGALQVRCTAAYPLQLMFFRDEKTRDLKWAGKPEKTVTVDPNGAHLSPRNSFATYVEEQAGYSTDWSDFDIVAGRELQILLTQITAKGERANMERQKDLVNHQRQQDLMIAELNHRVKNILALIRSLSRQAKDSSASLESYAQALEQRISALAKAHDLAVSDAMVGVSLRSILETELQPYTTEDQNQVLLSGPTVGLRSDVAPMIALVFHEIITNANKYGALSTADGLVRLKWDVSDKGLEVHWQEMNGPKVVPPSRHGFGRSLIEKAIPYEFDGEAKLEYPESGVTFEFSLPADTLVELTSDKEVKLVGSISKIEGAAEGAEILLVEDNVVLAMDMSDGLSRLGAKNVENAGVVSDALQILKKTTFDFAVLDMNLRGEVSFDIARDLINRGIPFLFVTGYGSAFDVPAELESIQILTKPIDDGSLSLAISRIYER